VALSEAWRRWRWQCLHTAEGDGVIDGVDDAAAWSALCGAMHTVGLSAAEQAAIFRLVRVRGA
jgi:myosin heavy subunit